MTSDYSSRGVHGSALSLGYQALGSWRHRGKTSDLGREAAVSLSFLRAIPYEGQVAAVGYPRERKASPGVGETLEGKVEQGLQAKVGPLHHSL